VAMAETGSTEGKIYTFDQLIRQRAVDEDQTPLLAYPRSKLGITDFELVSGKLLDRWVDGAAHALIQAGLAAVVSYMSASSAANEINANLLMNASLKIPLSGSTAPLI
jgi:hypothetical protein